MAVRRFERAGIAVVVALLILLPVAVHGWPASAAGHVFTIPLLLSGLGLIWGGSHPRMVALAGGGLWLLAAVLSRAPGVWFSDPSLAIMAALAGVAALAWTGRAAWLG